MKTGFVDCGGGTRGIFGAGVFDRLMDEGIRPDYFVGVSAGAANGASYIAGQKGRNYVFYDEYAFRKEYMSWENFRRTGSYIGMEYIYSTLSDQGGEYPLDYKAIAADHSGFEVVATNALTGRPIYFMKSDIRQDDYDVIKASCSVPVLNKPYYIGTIPCYDGGLSDPIPYKRVFRAGMDRVVVVITKPRDFMRTAGKDRMLSRAIAGKYPKAAEAWARRGEKYNRELLEVMELEKQGKALIVAPRDIGKLKTLSQDHEALEDLYRQGYEEGAKVVEFFAQKQG
ncbi:MAG: patatin family protein [Firmicutes bacterium]|nr:patatin family protein [Bacillota bacterium]